jgi:molybdate transport system regulatory protein
MTARTTCDRFPLRIKIQIYCGEEIAMGPGKADLLDAIRDHGSISAAGRALGMSYRRAWLLVDAMNRCWAEALVRTAPGAGGAHLSDLGIQVLADYRTLQSGAASAAKGEPWPSLSAYLLAEPRSPRSA